MLTAQDVITVLDASAEKDWAHFSSIHTTEYHALRLLAARERDGDGWGVVFDAIRGSVIDEREALRVGVFTKIFGSGVELGLHNMAIRSVPLAVDPALDDEDDDVADEAYDVRARLSLEGLKITGPNGALVCDDSMLEAYDLRPGKLVNDDGLSVMPADVLLVRAYLAVHPSCLWPPAEESVALLGLNEPEILIDSDAFAHVLGTPYPPEDEEMRKIAIAPSASATYRSVARAIAHRDGSAFEPGEPNIDWRLWVRFDDEAAGG